jgi:hypothetical protein
MRDEDGMTAHEAAAEAIYALELRVKWLTEEIADLRETGDALQAKADEFMGGLVAVIELEQALADWSETRERYDCEQ